MFGFEDHEIHHRDVEEAERRLNTRAVPALITALQTKFLTSIKGSCLIADCIDWIDCMDWIGLDWIGLDWIGLDWIGLDWIGLDWIGLD
jgi:hypothetical protein